MFSTDNRFEISVSISLLLQNLPLLVERVSLCSIQKIALKLVCQFRYCHKIFPRFLAVKLGNLLMRMRTLGHEFANPAGGRKKDASSFGEREILLSTLNLILLVILRRFRGGGNRLQ